MSPLPEPPELPGFELLLESQAGVLSRPQARRSGITDAAIEARLEVAAEEGWVADDGVESWASRLGRGW